MTHFETIDAAADTSDVAWCREVLRFWFDELSVDQWWRKDAGLDAQIRQRFLPVYERVASSPVHDIDDPRLALATVIVLDQFPRNMFRGEPRAYATDARARAVTRAAIAAGQDRALPTQERLFLYMPLQHSENAADQTLGVDLVAALGNEDFTRFALAHQRIIERFGRFPHRNEVLGRVSTPEELASLSEPMGRF